MKPFAPQAGWTVVSENPKGGLLVVLHYNRDGVEAWANVGTDNPGTSFYAEIIEVTLRGQGPKRMATSSKMGLASILSIQQEINGENDGQKQDQCLGLSYPETAATAALCWRRREASIIAAAAA